MFRCSGCKKISDLFSGHKFCPYCGEKYSESALSEYWKMIESRRKLSDQYGNRLGIATIALTLVFFLISYFGGPNPDFYQNLAGSMVTGFLIFIIIDIFRKPWLNRKFPEYKRLYKEYQKQVYGD